MTTTELRVKSHLHPKPSWDAANHQKPNGREEVWRFTPVKRMKALFESTDASATSLIKADLPDGCSSTVISAAKARELSIDPPVDLVAYNATESADALLIEVGAKTEVEQPLRIDINAEGGRINSHLIIEIGEQAVCTVVLRHTGIADLASKVEIHIGQGAQVNLVSLQDWDKKATHGGQITTEIGRDAQVRLVQASIGGNVIRQVERVQYAGPGGSLEQFGLYFVDSGEHVEHRIFIDHNEPETASYADYRGALQGKGAHSVWIGDVLIQANALNIDTYETNKNLVLTEGCQADSVPNLEIETGQIKGAGHSSSTGRFDEEQLYYLESRGIPEEQARRLMVEGFFMDLIRKIKVPEIQDRLIQALNEELACVEGVSDISLINQEDL